MWLVKYRCVGAACPAAEPAALSWHWWVPAPSMAAPTAPQMQTAGGGVAACFISLLEIITTNTLLDIKGHVLDMHRKQRVIPSK